VAAAAPDGTQPIKPRFFWQAALKFGGPRFFLAGGVFEVRGRVFFGRPRFFGVDREFLVQGPRIFCHQLRRQSAFFFLRPRFFGVCIHARAPIVIIRKARGNSKKCSNRPAKAAKQTARAAQAA
jgi:hypothetical protein